MLLRIVLGVSLLGLGGCSSGSLDNGILGFGEGRDALKKSVCYDCRSLTPFYEKGQWVEDR